MDNDPLPGVSYECPQRKCEAWSFAIAFMSRETVNVNDPQRKCEAWSFAMVMRGSCQSR